MNYNLRAMQASPAAQLSPQPVASPEPDEGSSNYLKIGLGVGLGVPFLILICAYITRYYKAARHARTSLPRYCTDVRPPTPPLRSDAKSPEQPRSPSAFQCARLAPLKGSSPTIRNRLTPNGSRRSLEEMMEEGINEIPVRICVADKIGGVGMSGADRAPPLIDVSGGPHFETLQLILPTYMSDPPDL